MFSSVEQQSGLSNTSKQVVLVCVEVKSKACALSLEVWLRLKVIPPPPSYRAAPLVPVFTPRVRQVNQLLVVATKSASEHEYEQCIKLTSGG